MRSFFSILLFVAASLLASQPSHAQDYGIEIFGDAIKTGPTLVAKSDDCFVHVLGTVCAQLSAFGYLSTGRLGQTYKGCLSFR